MKDEELFQTIKELIDNDDIYLLESVNNNQEATLCKKEKSDGSIVYEVFKFNLDDPSDWRPQVDLGFFEFSKSGFLKAMSIFLDNGGTIKCLNQAIEEHNALLAYMSEQNKTLTSPESAVQSKIKKSIKKKIKADSIEISIFGWGSFYMVKQMSKKEVKTYTDKDELSDKEIQVLQDKSDGYLEGFNVSSDIYINGELLCNIENLIKQGKKHPKYKVLIEASKETDLVPELKNAFLCIWTQKGQFVKFKTDNIYGFPSKKIPDKFIEDFLNNLEIATGNIFFLNEWNGEDLNNEFIGTVKDENNTIIADGEWYDCK
jgi:hypothetical protein